MQKLPETGAELKQLLVSSSVQDKYRKLVADAQNKPTEIINTANQNQEAIGGSVFDKPVDNISFAETNDSLVSEAENNQNALSELVADNKLRAFANEDRTLGEVASDTALSLSKNAILAGEAVTAIGEVVNQVTGKNVDLNPVMEGLKKGREFINSQMSDKSKAARAVVNKDVAKASQEITSDGSFWGDVKRQAAIASVNVESLVDNPTALIDSSLESALAFVAPASASALVGKVAAKVGANAVATATAKGAAGVAAIGATEAGSNAIESKMNVLGKSHEDLVQKSPLYNEKLDAELKDLKNPTAEQINLAREKAKEAVADNAFQYTYWATFATAAVTSKLMGTAKLESAGYKTGDIILDQATKPSKAKALATDVLNSTAGKVGSAVSKETSEEVIQGVTGEIIQNNAEYLYSDKTAKPLEGTGAAAAEGGLSAGATTAVLSTGRETLTAGANKLAKVAAQAQSDKKIMSAVDNAVSTGDYSKVSKLNKDIDLVVGSLVSATNLDKVKDDNNAAFKLQKTVSEIITDTTVRVDELAAIPVDKRTAAEKKELDTLSKQLSTSIELFQASFAGSQGIKDLKKQVKDNKIGNTEFSDRVLRTLGSSPQGLTTTVLNDIIETEEVSPEVKDIAEKTLVATDAVEVAQEARRNIPSMNQINDDVIVGGDNFVGLKQHSGRIKRALTAGNIEVAKQYLQQLGNFAASHTEKALDFGGVFEKAKAGTAYQEMDMLNQELTDRYGFNGRKYKIHGSSGAMVQMIQAEAQAIQAEYEALSQLVGYGESKPEVFVPVEPVMQAEAATEAVESVPEIVTPQPGISMESPKEGTVATPVPEPKIEVKKERIEPTISKLNVEKEKVQEVQEEVKEPVKTKINWGTDKVKIEEKVSSTLGGVLDLTGRINDASLDKPTLKKNVDAVYKWIEKNKSKLSIEQVDKVLTVMAKGMEDALNNTIKNVKRNEDGTYSLLNNAYMKGVSLIESITKPFHNKMHEVFQVAKNKGTINRIRNISNKLRNDRNSIGTFTTEENEVIDSFLKFEEGFIKAFKNTFAETNNVEDALKENNYTALVMDTYGHIDDNILSKMAASALEWALTDGINTVNFDARRVRKILGMESEEEVPYSLIAAMNQLGEPINMVAESVGSDFVKAMGIKRGPNTTAIQMGQLVSGFGDLLLQTMEEAKFITLNQYNKNYINDLKPSAFKTALGMLLTEESSAYKAITMVRINTIGGKRPIKLHPYLEAAKDALKRERMARAEQPAPEKKVLERLFDVSKPSTTPTFHIPEEYNGELMNEENESEFEIKKSKQKASRKQKQAVNKMSREPAGPTDLAIDFLGFTTAEQQELVGIDKDADNNNFVVAESIKASNDALLRDLDQSLEFLNEAVTINKPFYFPVVIWKNLRMGFANTVANPQTSKIARRLFGYLSSKSTLDFKNKDHKHYFILSLIEAFDSKDMMNKYIQAIDNGTVDAYFEETFNNDKIKELIAIYKKVANGEYEDENQRTEEVSKLIEFVKGTKTNLHALHGIKALSVMDMDNPFETDLILEVDGVANGVAIGVWQFAMGKSKPEFIAALKRAGIYDTADISSYVKWSKTPGNMDSYQVLGSAWHDKLQLFLKYVYPEIVGSLNFGDMKKIESNIEKLESLNIKPTTATKIMQDLIGHIKVNDIISSFGRNLSKSPTMTGNYGSSVKASINKIMDDQILVWLDKIGKNPSDAKHDEHQKELERMDALFSQLFAWEPTASMTIEQRRKFNFSEKQKSVLNAVMQHSHGSPLIMAMNDVYGDMLEKRSKIIIASQLMYNLSQKFKHDLMKKHFNKESESELTTTEEDFIENIMFEEGMYQILDTPFSEGTEDGLAIGKSEKVRSQKEEDKVVLRLKKNKNSTGKGAYRMSTVRPSVRKAKDPGVSIGAMMVQMLDAMTMALAQLDNVGLNEHDAKGMSIQNARYSIAQLNDSFKKAVMGEYDMTTAVLKQVEHMISKSDANTVGDIWWEMSTNMDTGKTKAAFKGIETVDQFTKAVKNTISRQNNLRNAVDVASISQYDALDSALQVKENNLIDSSVDKFFGSSEETSTTAKVDKEIPLSADSAIDIFDEVAKMGVVQESDSRLKQLRDIVGEFSQKITDPISFILGSTEGNTFGSYEGLKEKINVFVSVNPELKVGMSAAEVYAHELIHAVTVNVLRNGDMVARRIRVMYAAAQQMIDDGNLSYVDFLPLDQNGNTIATPTAEQIKIAKDRFNYIFRNKNIDTQKSVDVVGMESTKRSNAGLEEFVAFGATNAPFMAALNKPQYAAALKLVMKAKTKETKSDAKLVKYLDRMINSFLDLVKEIIDTVFNKIQGIDSKKYDQQLHILLATLVGINTRHKTKMGQQIDMLGSWNEAVRSQIAQWIVEPLVKWAGSDAVRGSKNTFKRATARVITATSQSKAGEFTKVMREVRARLKQNKESFGTHLLTNIRGRTKDNRHLHLMLAKANNHIDQMRKYVQRVVKNILTEQFKGKLNIEQKESITRVGYMGDMSRLLDVFSGSDIYKLVTEPSFLLDQINRYDKLIRSNSTHATGNWFVAMGDSLADIMVNGGAGTVENSVQNAYLIANQALRLNKDKTVDASKMEDIIDVYVSLKALTLQTPEDIKNIKDVIDSEVSNGASLDENGFIFALRIHDTYKQDALDISFDGNKTNMKKGYIKEIFNPNKAIRFSVSANDTALLEQGYKIIKMLDKDDDDLTVGEIPNLRDVTDFMRRNGVSEEDIQDFIENPPLSRKPQVFMYSHDDAKLATYQAGIVSGTDVTHAGTDLFDGYVIQESASMDQNATSDYIKGVYSQSAKQAGRDKSRIAKQKKQKNTAAERNNYKGNRVKLLPILSEYETLAGYRYVMSNQDKKTLLERHDAFDDVMGHMESHMKDKANSKTINRALVDASIEEYTKSNNKRDYVYIGPDSTKLEYREIWYRLPSDMKRHIKNKSDFNGLMIHHSNVSTVFGFRKLTLDEISQRGLKSTRKYLQNDLAKYVFKLLGHKYVGVAEEAWKDLMKMVRDVIVVKSGVVAVGNIISNIVLLRMHGVPFHKIIKLSSQAWKAANDYQDAKYEHDRIEFELKANAGTMSITQIGKLKNKLVELETEMNGSPVSRLIDLGVYQTIVEEVDPEEVTYGYKNKLEDIMSPVTNRVPDVVMDLGKVFFMAQDTKLYQAMRNATQMSDFVARYVMFEYEKEQGKNEMDALDSAVENFVNYDIPMHRSLHWLSDMGILWFPKFFLGVQKVIYKLATEKTGNLLALFLMEHFLDLNLDDPTDASVLRDDAIESKFGLTDPVTTILSGNIINLAID